MLTPTPGRKETQVQVREFRTGDEPFLFRVYYSAIHQIARQDYTETQLNAWAPADLDPALWAEKVQGIKPFFVELGTEIVGYADVQDNAYIDHFFVSGAHARQGVGGVLMKEIHAKAARLQLRELFADVSRTAQPFFARHGFVVAEQRLPLIRGVQLSNALMRKILQNGWRAEG